MTWLTEIALKKRWLTYLMAVLITLASIWAMVSIKMELIPDIDPPLTTVDLPYNALGARAGERLLHLISGEGRSDQSPVLVAGPVHWRASVNELRPENVLSFRNLREEKE